MNPDRYNNDGINKYKLGAYRWKRRLVAKSGEIGISALVSIYVYMYACMNVYTRVVWKVCDLNMKMAALVNES